MKLIVSIPTFDEIASALEKAGQKINETATLIQLEKNTEIKTQQDLRLMTVRRDCADIATKVYKSDLDGGFIPYINNIYQFVLNGTVSQFKPEEEKQSNPTETSKPQAKDWN